MKKGLAICAIIVTAILVFKYCEAKSNNFNHAGYSLSMNNDWQIHELVDSPDKFGVVYIKKYDDIKNSIDTFNNTVYISVSKQTEYVSLLSMLFNHNVRFNKLNYFIYKLGR